MTEAMQDDGAIAKPVQKKKRWWLRLFVLVAVILAGLSFCISWFLKGMVPMRAGAGEGLVLAGSYKNAVVDFHVENQRWPRADSAQDMLELLGSDKVVSMRGQYTRAITVKNDGVIEVQVTDRVAPGGGVMLLVPTVEVSGRISWHCYSPDIAADKLPEACC